MEKQNLEKLSERFEEMKREADALRLEFFTRVFSDHQVYDQAMLDRLEKKGPPDLMVVHPSMSHMIRTNFMQYCRVMTSKWVKEKTMYFLWRSDYVDTPHQAVNHINYRKYFENINN